VAGLLSQNEVKSLDGAIRSRIATRVARFEDGNFADHKAVGNGVFEARFFWIGLQGLLPDPERRNNFASYGRG